MSPDQHASAAPGHADAVAHHQTADQGEDHGHDDHAHGVDELGPIDVAAWGAGLAGVVIAIVIAACFVLATSGLA